jgi:hypothetical protein
MVVVSFGGNFCLYWNVEQRRKKSTPQKKCFSTEYPSAEAPPRRMKRLILFPGHPGLHSFSDAGRPQNGEAKNYRVNSIYIS